MRADLCGKFILRMPLVAIVLVGVFLANPSQAATIFRNEADWLAAAGGAMTTDDFSTNKTGLSFSFDSGVVSSISASGTHFISAGELWVTVNPTFVTWVFPSPVAAFGINYFSINANTMVVGNFDGTGNQTIQIAPLGSGDGFFGLIGAATFTTVVFENAGGVMSDSFRVTKLSFGGEPLTTSEVPLPAALPLFATGLGAIGLMGWRRKRKAAAAA